MQDYQAFLYATTEKLKKSKLFFLLMIFNDIKLLKNIIKICFNFKFCNKILQKISAISALKTFSFLLSNIYS